MAGAVTATDGETWAGDAIVLAAGSRPNFFGTPGADLNSFPLYSLNDAQRLRSRIIAVFEDADRDPSLLDRGALNFVVVGGGPTGVETAGALADMIDRTMTMEYPDLPVTSARVHIVDLGHTLLGPFSKRAHHYVEKVLQRKGVELHLDTKVTEVAPGHVTLGDGTEIPTRCVVWGGGITAPALAAAAGVAQGRGGRIDVEPELTLKGFPRVYAVGDVANIAGPDGEPLPQLGSVALQSGVWAAKNLLADFAGASSAAVPLSRQGHHGDDRPRLGDRRDGQAPLRAARPGRIRGLARGAPPADDGRSLPHAGRGRLDLRQRLANSWPPVARPRGGCGDRLERRPHGRARHRPQLEVTRGPEPSAGRGAHARRAPRWR